ncbi:MAG TPA: SH3 domain-containing protein [Clostridiaceae bacterium]|nr:SH3 domain-containing protein [Clostridiaceae bacterium]
MHKVYMLKKVIDAKIPLSVFAMALLFLLFSPIIHAEAAKEGIVTTDCLNVRQTPSTSATIIAQLLRDTKVEIIEANGEWYKISYNNMTGWVHGDYVNVKEVNAQPESQTEAVSMNVLSASDTASGDLKDKGVVTASVLNVRENVGTSSKIVAQIKKGMEINVLESRSIAGSETWYHIEAGNVKGWVCGDYISFDFKPIDKGVITGNVVNVRASHDIKAKVIGQVKQGEKFDVYSWYGDWYKIKLENGSFGWVNYEYINTNYGLGKRPTVTLASRGQSTEGDRNSDLRQQVVDLAKSFYGVKYVWGGTSPNGFDCSGLVYYVYKRIGITLNRVAADQAKQGIKVSKAELKPGDLVFFNTGSGYIDHTGIYIGNGQFIHASGGRGRVVIDSLNQGYYSRVLVTARRIIR